MTCPERREPAVRRAWAEAALPRPEPPSYRLQEPDLVAQAVLEAEPVQQVRRAQPVPAPLVELPVRSAGRPIR